MRYGSLDIARVSINPERYSVTFATPEAPSVPSARSFARLEEVDEFLQEAGVTTDQIRQAVADARQTGMSSIPNHALSDRELHYLGLVTWSGAKG